MLSNKKPTPAIARTGHYSAVSVCAPEIGRTTAWIYVVLPKRLIGWHMCLRVSSGQGQQQPDLSGISSLPGRFFLGLSEEVCPEALWLAESLSLKESKIY